MCVGTRWWKTTDQGDPVLGLVSWGQLGLEGDDGEKRTTLTKTIGARLDAKGDWGPAKKLDSPFLSPSPNQFLSLAIQPLLLR